MMNSMQSKKNSYLIALSIIVIGAFSRLIPHLPNFSMIEGLALFGGAYLGSRLLSVAVPIAALYVSDLVINNTVARPFFPEQEGFIFFHEYMIFNAVAMIAIVIVAQYALKKVTAGRVIASALASSLLFFVVSNIGSWISLPIYSKDFAGLAAAFIAAVPFYQNTWISGVLFSVLLFGSFELYKSYTGSKLKTAVAE